MQVVWRSLWRFAVGAADEVRVVEPIDVRPALGRAQRQVVATLREARSAAQA